MRESQVHQTEVREPVTIGDRGYHENTQENAASRTFEFSICWLAQEGTSIFIGAALILIIEQDDDGRTQMAATNSLRRQGVWRS